MSFFLRAVLEDDLPVFFEQQLDQEAIHMAAFTARRAAFMAHWHRMLVDPTIIARKIFMNGQIAGHVMSYEAEEKPEVTYWLGRKY